MKLDNGNSSVDRALTVGRDSYLGTQMSTDLSQLEEIYGSKRLRFN